MYRKPPMLLTILLTFTGSAVAAPVTQFAPGSVSQTIDTVVRADETQVILVQNRGREWRRSAVCWRWSALGRWKPQR